ncbi:MAG TPA: transglutaminase domain-containing protein [Rectinemataceae bacterium]|nr:transglutaminase domain-containing protein [Rectinemataceae bacterium]
MIGKTRGKVAGIVVLTLAIAAASYWRLEAPRIFSVDPLAFTPGEIVVIRGQNFGAARENRRVLLDSSPLTQSSYISWSDDEIALRLPASVDSGLLQVIAPLGSSNAEIVIGADRLPEKPENAVQAAAGPSIMAVNPAEASVGSLVEIDGINFGSNVQFSDVRFSRNAVDVDLGGTDAATPSSAKSGAGDYVEPEEPSLMYESWDDKSIAVRVPEGAGSGTVVVSTPQGESAPFTFRVKQGSGSKYLYDPAVYSIQLKIRIRKPDAKAPGTIVLYVPNLATSFSQSLDSIQEEDPKPYMGDYGKVAVFKISDFEESDMVVSRTALVTVHGVESDLAAYSDSFANGKPPPFLKAYVTEDSLVPSAAKEILTLIAKVAGKERNLQKKALLIRNWLAKSIAWKASQGARDTPLSALKEGKAASKPYALLASALFRASGIPALPISGFLVRKDGVTIPHFWMEYYLPAVGWIPYDPVLALGSRPSGFDAALDDPDHYFGSLDNRHIAISRGLTEVAPLLGGSDTQTAKAQWSFQTLFEESIGGAYSSAWQEAEITGSY